MTRLIDADALNIYDVSPAYGTCVMGVTEEDIDEAPTVDAVPVVRCKDCDNYKHWECPVEQAGYRPMGDMYCAWAERKEE